MTMYKAKILMLGPCQGGKTAIANFLSEATETISSEYSPTQGVRIVEFEVTGLEVSGRRVTADVELWDCSGDQKFENCWPAFSKDSAGVIFVYNPDGFNHDKELERWYSYFVDGGGGGGRLSKSQCLIFCHHKPGVGDNVRTSISDIMSGIGHINTNIESDPDVIRQEFNHFLTQILCHIAEARDAQERSIIGIM